MLHLAVSSSNILVPSCCKIRDHIKKFAQKSHLQILAMIPHDEKISIAADCWISPINKAFLAVICYFFTEDFDYKEALLRFEPLHGTHHTRYLADTVIKVLKCCDLEAKILAATTDNASNNNEITEQYNDSLQNEMNDEQSFCSCAFDPEILHLTESATHIPCLVHVIQLSVHALLNSVKVTA